MTEYKDFDARDGATEIKSPEHFLNSYCSLLSKF